MLKKKREKKREGNNLCVVYAHDCCCVCFHIHLPFKHVLNHLNKVCVCIDASNRVARIIGYSLFYEGAGI